MVRAREAASTASDTDPALDALAVPTGSCRRVLAALRRGQQTTVALSQPKVGGGRAVARINELKKLGWLIEKERCEGGTLWWIVSEPPTPSTGRPEPGSVDAAPAAVPAPLELVPRRATFGPYHDFDEAA